MLYRILIVLLLWSAYAFAIDEDDYEIVSICNMDGLDSYPAKKTRGDIIDSLAPRLLKNLPTVQERLANPRNGFTPVIGYVESLEVVAYSYEEDPTTVWCDGDCYAFSTGWKISFIGKTDREKALKFTEWSRWLDSTQRELSKKASIDQSISYYDFKFNYGIREVFSQLLKVQIKAADVYDYSTQSWKETDTTVHLYLPVITAPQWVSSKDGNGDSVDMIKNIVFVPKRSPRVFFGDGYSQDIVKSVKIDEFEQSTPIQKSALLKVLPYKFSFRIPENRSRKLAKKALYLFGERRYNEAVDAMEEALNAADSTYPIFKSPFRKSDYEWLNLLSGNGIRLTPYDESKHSERHPSLGNHQIGFPSRDIDKWLESGNALNDVLKIEDDFSRIFAQVKLMERKPSHDKGKGIEDLIRENAEKISDARLRVYLGVDYLHELEGRARYKGEYDFRGGYHERPDDPYVLVGMGVALDFPLGDFGAHVDPVYGFAFRFGLGRNRLGFESQITGFGSRKMIDGRSYETYFAGLDFHYGLLFTRLFDVDAYAGPTLNWVGISVDGDKFWTIKPGVDFGVSAGIFSPYHAVGLRLRLGSSTEKNVESLTLKPYIALDFLLKSYRRDGKWM